jgi:hypothetical protein
MRWVLLHPYTFSLAGKASQGENLWFGENQGRAKVYSPAADVTHLLQQQREKDHSAV